MNAPVPPDATDRLTDWNPSRWDMHPDWRPLVQGFLDSAEGQALGGFLKARLNLGAVVFPPQPFRALALTAPQDVRVVILGQDPYHGPGQAQGLAFSVTAGQRVPPSLRNIHRELARDLGLAVPPHGSLQAWARRGVLLLNASLTVEQGLPASHAACGWDLLCQRLLSSIVMRRKPCVYLLWGVHAQAMGARVLDAGDCDGGLSLVLRANHPSPLSALRGPTPFLGCSHFSQASRWLATHQIPMDWSLPAD